MGLFCGGAVRVLLSRESGELNSCQESSEFLSVCLPAELRSVIFCSESPSLEVSKGYREVALGDGGSGERGSAGGLVDSLILEGFSNPNHSVMP